MQQGAWSTEPERNGEITTKNTKVTKVKKVEV